MGCRQALTVHQAQQLVALPQVHGVISRGVEGFTDSHISLSAD